MEYSARLFFLTAITCLLALPAGAQGPAPYFSLDSNRTFMSSEEPTVGLWTNEAVKSLEFRLYRVRDAVAFFSQLGELHNFGGRAPRLPGEITPIERFRRFKRRASRHIEDLFRVQFTAEVRADIRTWMSPSTSGRPPVMRTNLRGAETFPQVPLLNPQQVVAVWKMDLVREPGRTPYVSDRLRIPASGSGIYVLEATNGDLRAFTIVVVTDAAILTRSAPGRMLSMVVDRRTGAPRRGVEVVAISSRKEFARIRTGEDGIADIAIREERPENVALIATDGSDVAVSGPNSWQLRNLSERNATGYIFTDRPVYRPGHDVRFKAILRTHDGLAYRLPARATVDAEILDSDDQTVYRQTLKVSAAGSIHGSFKIPANAPLGAYGIRIHLGEYPLYSGFQVDEYRKPEYEVRVMPSANRVIQGGVIPAVIEARYFYGEPVAGANVTWVVHRSRHYSFPADEDYEFEEFGGDSYGGEQLSEQSGRLDVDGRLQITIPTGVSDEGLDWRYRIEARVTDEAGREIPSSSSVVVPYASHTIQVRPEAYVYAPGATGQFEIRLQDHDGNPVSGQPVRAELAPPTRSGRRQPPVHRTQAVTDSLGVARIEMPLASAGAFEVRASATSPERREIQDTAWVWVSGGGTEADFGGARERVQLVPDKAAYQPGDTAEILVIAPVSGAAVLVTVQGRTLHSYEVHPAAPATFRIRVPVQAGYAPNFFVAAAFVKDNVLFEGRKSVKVPSTAQQLVVEVQPSQTTFSPGQPATYTVTTKDSVGQPVPAEVSVGIVDEAVYAVRPDSAGDIHRFFYGPVYDAVGLDSSLVFYFHGAAGKRSMDLAALRPSTALAQLKPGALVQPRVRKAFPDTAYWIADLVTNASGRAEIRLEFPDSLTTWRATARAVTRDTRAGSAVQKTIVRKDVIVRLATPRFFTEGDEVTVSGLVHNYMDTETTAQVSLEVAGLEVVSGGTENVSVPAGGDARVDWRVRATRSTTVRLTAKAMTNRESDALEIEVPVIPFGVKMSEAGSGVLASSSDTVETTVDLPESSPVASRRLEVRLTPSVGGALFGALDYLTSFPYGCTEQTMSSFLPNVIVTRALRDLKIPSAVDEAALAQRTREGLRRLYDSQHPDGGWGWWPSDDSAPFMTAYVVAGLSAAGQAGVEVQADVVDRGAQWLAAEFSRTETVVADLRAYMFYALQMAGRAEDRHRQTIWDVRSRMSPHGKALLALALETVDRNRSLELLREIESDVRTEGPDAWWSNDQDYLMGFTGSSSAETTAYVIQLLARLKPDSPLLPSAARWLIRNRNEGFYWSSTKQTAMVVYGLTDYLRLTGELRPDYTVRVYVNDRLAHTQRFIASDALAVSTPPVMISPDHLNSGRNRIRFEKSGSGTLYWAVRSEHYSQEESLQRTGTIALNLLRDYFRLVPETIDGRITYRLEPFDGTARQGEVLAVRLTVSGGPWRYLMAEDPIPSGTEFVRRDDLYEVRERPTWWQSSYTRREMRDDRAVFFESAFHGQRQYMYLIKVTHAGAFRVSAARATPMYQPGVMATSAHRNVVVP